MEATPEYHVFRFGDGANLVLENSLREKEGVGNKGCESGGCDTLGCGSLVHTALYTCK